MDLAELKNMDVKDLLGKIKGVGAGNIFQDKKTLIKFGICFGSILIFLIIYYALVNPTINEQKKNLKKWIEFHILVYIPFDNNFYYIYMYCLYIFILS